jgi:hypothetical protein
VISTWANSTTRKTSNRRATARTPVALPARLTWKDQRGSDRFASVIVRDLSDTGVFVELPSPIAINVFRLAHVQIERQLRESEGVPAVFRQSRLMAAVYRVRPATRAGGKQGIALRLLVPPRRGERDITRIEESQFSAASAEAAAAV